MIFQQLFLLLNLGPSIELCLFRCQINSNFNQINMRGFIRITAFVTLDEKGENGC